jgi:hypothetical protein
MSPVTSPLSLFVNSVKELKELRKRLVSDTNASVLTEFPTLREELTYSTDDCSLDGLRRVYNRVYQRGLKLGVPKKELTQKLDAEYSELREEMLEHLTYLNAKKNLDAFREEFDDYVNKAYDEKEATWNDLDWLDEVEHADFY